MKGRERPAALALAGAVLALSAGPSSRAASDADFTRYVALGDGLTAGFVNGNLFDGTRADPPTRLGQRESYAVRLAEAYGAPVVLPLVTENGLPILQYHTLERKAGVCAINLKPKDVPYTVNDGTGARADPSARATVVAVPGQSLAAAIGTKWSVDPSDPRTLNSALDYVLGEPWASEGAPPRSQLETAVALAPTFATVWFGVDEALAAVAGGSDAGMTSEADFRDRIERVVGDLAAAGARGAVATVPDVTVLPYFMPQPTLRRLIQSTVSYKVKDVGLFILFGLRRKSYLVFEQNHLSHIAAISDGSTRAPLYDGEVLTPREALRVRRRIRLWNRAVVATAARHGWAVADVAAQFESWRRKGVDVGDAHLTNGFFGGLFDLTGKSLSPTAQALVARTFAAAIDAKYGATHAPIDAAAVLAGDPLAPCAK